MKKGYVRRTSKKGKEDAISIPAQIEKLRLIGFEEFYKEDGKTASLDEEDFSFEVNDDNFIVKFNIKKRPEFKQLLFDAKNKVLKEIGVWKWDRFARNQLLQKAVLQYLKQQGVEYKASEDTNDPLAMDFMSIISEQESKKTKDRVDMAKQHKFNLGLYIGTQRKKGYKWQKVSIKGKDYKTLVPDEEEKKVIQGIFKDALSMDYKEVCAKYNLHPQTFYNLMKDDFYVGMIRYKGQVKKGKHKGIISNELFDKVFKKFYNKF